MCEIALATAAKLRCLERLITPDIKKKGLRNKTAVHTDGKG